MAKRIMSDAEIKRRKRLQGHLSQATGTIGLAALTGTMIASRPGRKALRKIPKVDRVLKKPPPRDPNRDHIKGALTPALATSAGIGGLGAFNFAAYTNAESRKRKAMEPVKKRDEMAPDYGEVAKAWSPTTHQYDPEAKRAKRNKVVAGTLAGAGSAGVSMGAWKAGGATFSRQESVRQSAKSKKLKAASTQSTRTARKHRMATKVGAYNWAKSGGTKEGLEGLKDKELKTITRWPKNEKRAARGFKQAAKQKKGAAHSAKESVKLGREASRDIKSAGKWGAGGAVALGTGLAIGHRAKSKSWQSYSKRDASAFGVVHD